MNLSLASSHVQLFDVRYQLGVTVLQVITRQENSHFEEILEELGEPYNLLAGTCFDGVVIFTAFSDPH